MENLIIVSIIWLIGFFGVGWILNPGSEFSGMKWAILIFVWPCLLALDVLCWLIAIEEMFRGFLEDQLHKIVDYFEHCKGITSR